MTGDMNPARLFLRSAEGVLIDACVDAAATNDHDESLRGVAAVAHPHPQYGGNMHNNVVMALSRGLTGHGVATVRFDFRGVGESTGEHGTGDAERNDLTAALDHAATLGAHVPLLTCGYSFGADVALTIAHPRSVAWLVVAPPIKLFADDAYLAALDARPVHIIAGVHDQFASPVQVRAVTAGWRNVHVHIIEGADHFFGATTGRIAELTGEIVNSLL